MEGDNPVFLVLDSQMVVARVLDCDMRGRPLCADIYRNLEDFKADRPLERSVELG